MNGRAIKYLTALTLVALVLTFGACNGIGDPDYGPFKNKFKTTDFSSAIFKAAPDSLGVRPLLLPIEDDTLDEGQFAVRMQPVKKLHSTKSKCPAIFQVVRSAYACSGPIPSSDDVIEDIRISSNKRFTADRPPGEDRSELFDIVVLNRSKFGTRRFELNKFLEREPNAADELILILDAAPDRTSDFQFTVEYEQDGKGLEHFAFETEPVVLASSGRDGRGVKIGRENR